MDPEPDSVFSVFICNGKSAAGAEVRKVYPAGALRWHGVLILLAVEPLPGFNLDEVLARSYEDLVIRGRREN
ncbi:MAG: hypothetical protein ACLSE4_12975 [Clostridium sp.]